MTRFFIFQFLALTCFFAQTWAQKVFSRGYLLLAGGDTLRGLVEERPGYTLVNSIGFKNQEGSEPESHDITSLKGFFLVETGESFVCKKVTIDKKGVNTNQLDRSLAKKNEEQFVVLKLLIGGKAALLQYIDENGKAHFFFRKLDEIQELGFVRYLNESGAVGELEEYNQQMKNLFSDCSSVSGRRYSYSTISLTKAFRDYNICVNALSFEPKAVKKQSKLSLKLWIGAAYNGLNYVGVDNLNSFTGDYASGVNYPSLVQPYFGVTLDLPRKRLSNPIGGNIDFFYRRSGPFTGGNGANDFLSLSKEYELSFSCLSLTPSIKYFITRGSRVSVYAKFGMGITFVLKSDTKMTTSLVGYPEPPKTYSPLIVLADVGYNFLVVGGASIGRLEVNIGYAYNLVPAQSDVSQGAKGSAQMHLTSPGLAIGYKVF